MRLAQRFSATYRMLLNKYFVDEIYAAAVVRPLVRLSDGFLFRFLDALVIDGAANGLAARARGFGAAARQVQSGNIRSYAAWVLLGAVSALFLVGLLWGY
jgi:NADH-quinone oxidoreductase subunit L